MAERTLDEEIQALKEDVALLRSDMADLTSSIRGMASERSEGIKAELQNEIRQTRERLREKIAQARNQGMQTMEEMEESIGQHPLASVATAVGIGFVIAKLMGRGGHD